MVTLVGHKFRGLKDRAALYVRPGCLVERGQRDPGLYWSAGALLLVGGQEGGRRVVTKNIPYIVGLERAEKLLNSDNKWRDNVACVERKRIRLLDRIKTHLSLSPFFSAMGLPTYYAIGTLSLSVGPSTTDKEVEDTVQFIAEEVIRQITSVS